MIMNEVIEKMMLTGVGFRNDKIRVPILMFADDVTIRLPPAKYKRAYLIGSLFLLTLSRAQLLHLLARA